MNGPNELGNHLWWQMVGNFYEGGETEFVKVCRNLTYSELSRVVQGVANVDLTRFSIELRTLVDTGVRLRLARPKIKDDSDVEMLLCDGGHVSEVDVSVFEKDPTINEDESLIPEYNSHSEYGLEDFDEDYISDGGSREGVNDEETYHHGMISGRSLKPKEIMTDMQVEHGLSLLYTKALRAKELTEQNVFGSHDLSYRLLPVYCHELKRVNHEEVQTVGDCTSSSCLSPWWLFMMVVVGTAGLSKSSALVATHLSCLLLAYGFSHLHVVVVSMSSSRHGGSRRWVVSHRSSGLVTTTGRGSGFTFLVSH
ncbi:hypothetical protein Ddye_008586 [Dipteronia dyeriana]|uniref:Uncharacterized protein n=1 Tax=Dipteronia dyeriana TaxID=168575 RepID=A0AAD9X9U5_9ROSI|nr:hypothetical protein Ddye_008586 [Dipteronia dyeriana]